MHRTVQISTWLHTVFPQWDVVILIARLAGEDEPVRTVIQRHLPIPSLVVLVMEHVGPSCKYYKLHHPHTHYDVYYCRCYKPTCVYDTTRCYQCGDAVCEECVAACVYNELIDRDLFSCHQCV
jgi:hypothetical protein